MRASRDGAAAAHPGPATAGTRRDAILVALLVLMAAAIARHVLGPAALSPADANRALAAKAASIGELGATSFADLGHAPVLALVLRASGGSVLAGQMIAFAAALATPGVVYAVARRLSLGRSGAFAAGAVIACSNLQVVHAGTLGTGTIVTLVSALLIFQGAGALAATDRDDLRHRLILLGATTVAGGLTALLVLPAAGTVWAVVLASSARRFGARTLFGPVLAGIDVAVVYALFVLPADAGASLRDSTATGGHLVDDRGAGELLRSLGRAYERTLADLGPSADPARLAEVVLGAAFVTGAVVLAVRMRRGAWLVLLPPLAATGLALAHVVPLGGPAGTWLLPALAVCVAAAIELAVGPLPTTPRVVAAIALLAVSTSWWDAARYAGASPALDPLVGALASVPASECAVINGIEPAQFHWATTWDIDLVGRVPGGPWVRVRYPRACVSFPGAAPDRFDATEGTAPDPGSAVLWWVRPTADADAEPPASFAVAERRPAGWYEILLLRRR